ncbi:MAG: S9 family peptidase [Saprospiraceae bacterium]|nr:S9 family peptidase [Saprospiraceae bacterium]
MNIINTRFIKPTIYILFCLTFNACIDMDGDNKTIDKNQINAPIAEKKDSIIITHGHERVDPYFWMRLTDDQKNASEPDEQTQKVLNYLNDENAYLKSKLKHTETFQDELYSEIIGRIKKTDESVPYFKNGYWYYTKYVTDKEYAIYCRKRGDINAAEEILLDVNKMAEGKNYYAVSGLSVSPNNKILAFGEDDVSRRIYKIRFLNLETGEFFKDEIENTSGGGAWANDNTTYFYTTKNKISLLSEKIYRHELGVNNSNDEMVYHEKDPSFYIGVYRSKSGKYIIIYNSSTISSDYHILNTNEPKGAFQQFATREDNHEYSIDHFENKFYVVTNWNAQNFRLMETSEQNTGKENWTEVIPHRKDVLLEDIEVFKNFLVVSERSNASTYINIINQKTKGQHSIDFGEEAYVAYVGTNPEFDTDKLRFGYSSLTTPSSTYDYDMNTKQKELKKQSEVVGGHKPENYETKRLFATARDGKKIPISIVYKKGFNQNGSKPLLLYAYGSYGSSMDPWFSSTRLSLLDRGFAWAIAHIRGGEEMGRQWYEDGKMFNKINTFNDYNDCAKYLIQEKYTSADHLYAMGGSAGGLLMGAILNMEPDLYNGVIAAVPFVDVVSTMLDETIPLTTNEFDEWGNPKNKDAYEYMLSYSPYDQVQKQDYPNILITTGLFDSQVQYWEPAKWIAKLRDYKTDDNLLIMHTNMEAGHGGASGRFKRYKETALEYAFLLDLEGINQ